MSSKNTISVGPVEKRGGMRRPLRRKPSQKENPQDIFKDMRAGPFPKRLTQYRFLFCTDFTANDLLFFQLFTAWVKTNEKTFDKSNHFPIYGFVTSGDTKIRTQRIREYLAQFAECLAWDDPEHHLYKGYQSAGERIWFDSIEEALPQEKSLIDNEDIIDNPEYPVGKPLEEGLVELTKVKPSNLFIVKLRDTQNPNFNKFIEGCQTVAVDNSKVMTEANFKKLFKNLEEAGDEDFFSKIRKAMFTFGDHRLEELKQGLPEAFKEVDWESVATFNKIAEAYPDDKTVSEISLLLKNESRVLHSGSADCMLELLKATNKSVPLEKALTVAMKLF